MRTRRVPFIHVGCPTWRDTCSMPMNACGVGEWGTAHTTDHDLSLDLCARHILWCHMVCALDSDRLPAGSRNADSWQSHARRSTADG